MVHETERELLALMIGYRVREARKKYHLSQGELARGIGSQSMISLIESGRQLPPPDVLHALATRLDDPDLVRYAQALQSDELSLAGVVTSSPEALYAVLRNRRSRWDPIHGQLTLHLCQYYYMDHKFETVRELAEMICENMAYAPGYQAEGAYYLGSALLAVQEYTAAEYWLLKSEKTIQHCTDELRGRLMYNLGLLYTMLDVQGLSLWYAKNAVDTFHRIADFERYTKSLGLLGTVQYRIGRMDDARLTLERCLEIGEKWGTTGVDKGRLLVTLAAVYFSLHDLPKAKQLAEEGVLAAEQSEDINSQCEALNVMAEIHSRSGEGNGAKEILQKYIQLAEQTRDPYQIAQSHLIAVTSLASDAERLNAAQRAYEVTLDTNLHIEHALAAERLAECYEEMGYTGEARHYHLAALRAYRAYVAKNSMYKDILNLRPADRNV